MKLKRLLALLLAFVMCFVFASCKDNSDKDSGTPTSNTEQITEAPEASQNEGSSPILYRVTDKNGNILWLFGSIHIGREDYYPLPDYVQKAFDEADMLAVEADIVAYAVDTNQQMQAMSHLVYNDGTSVKDMGQAMAVIDGAKKYAACIGGMLSVLDGKVTLVPTTFEWADKIDVSRAERSESRARAVLDNKSSADTDIRLAEARLKRALIRQSVANRR